MLQKETEICMCKHYHEEDGACGWFVDLALEMGIPMEFLRIEEPVICNRAECTYELYITAEDIIQPDGFDGQLVDAEGNVNWRLAFRMP